MEWVDNWIIETDAINPCRYSCPPDAGGESTRAVDWLGFGGAAMLNNHGYPSLYEGFAADYCLWALVSSPARLSRDEVGSPMTVVSLPARGPDLTWYR
jgi:hypothetical protein